MHLATTRRPPARNTSLAETPGGAALRHGALRNAALRHAALCCAALCCAALALAAPPARAASVDFETPSLGALDRMVINPYVATGVSFVAVARGVTSGEVGLVKNSATSACADPPDANQKLGTAPAGSGAIGLSDFTIRANFSPYLSGLVQVSAQFQTISGSTVRILLYDNYGYLMTSAIQTALPGAGTCGYPGTARARRTVTATGHGTVAYALLDVEPNGVVFVIDEFRYATGVIAVREGAEGESEATAVAFGAPAAMGPSLSVAPNPARAGEASIGFRAPSGSPIDLAIYDVAGRRVRSLLASGAPHAGSVAWDGLDDAGRPLGAGAYFVRLEGGGTRETERITLIR